MGLSIGTSIGIAVTVAFFLFMLMLVYFLRSMPKITFTDVAGIEQTLANRAQLLHQAALANAKFDKSIGLAPDGTIETLDTSRYEDLRLVLQSAGTAHGPALYKAFVTDQPLPEEVKKAFQEYVAQQAKYSITGQLNEAAKNAAKSVGTATREALERFSKGHRDRAAVDAAKASVPTSLITNGYKNALSGARPAILAKVD